jgi:hypothetical protein
MDALPPLAVSPPDTTPHIIQICPDALCTMARGPCGQLPRTAPRANRAFPWTPREWQRPDEAGPALPHNSDGRKKGKHKGGDGTSPRKKKKSKLYRACARASRGPKQPRRGRVVLIHKISWSEEHVGRDGTTPPATSPPRRAAGPDLTPAALRGARPNPATRSSHARGARTPSALSAALARAATSSPPSARTSAAPAATPTTLAAARESQRRASPLPRASGLPLLPIAGAPTRKGYATALFGASSAGMRVFAKSAPSIVSRSRMRRREPSRRRRSSGARSLPFYWKPMLCECAPVSWMQKKSPTCETGRSRDCTHEGGDAAGRVGGEARGM